VSGKLLHFRHLSGWYEQWCDPIVFELYRENLAQCRVLLASAHTELERGALNADDTQALRLQLDFLEFQFEWNLGGDDVDGLALWNAVMERLNIETCGETSAHFRNFLLLIVRVLGDLRGHRACPEAEFTALFERIPPGDRDSEFWYYAAVWAAAHDSRRYIGLAYEEMLTEPGGFLRHEIWLRINLIYLLMEGRAAERDVIETIKVFTHHNQMRRFTESIWPRIEQAGLDTPAVCTAVEHKRAELRRAQMEPPKF
jgi:hypothetical protein